MDESIIECPKCKENILISDILKFDDANNLTNKNIGFFLWYPWLWGWPWWGWGWRWRYYRFNDEFIIVG